MKRFPYIDGRKNLCTELSFMPRCILKMSQAGLGFEIHFGLERYSPFLAFGRGSFEAEEAAAPPTRVRAMKRSTPTLLPLTLWSLRYTCLKPPSG